MTTPFTVLTAVAAPLPMSNVDTDTIIRVEPLFGGVPRDKLGPHALAALRYRVDGSEDPDFVLNRAAYRGAGILVTGPNFGCGSSREGAVWALLATGIRCVIAPSFGDIFYANCFQNGLLPMKLPPAAVETLLRVTTHAPGSTLIVDLHACTLRGAGFPGVDFDLPARRREGLLKGLDDLEITLTSSAQIDAFQARDAVERPWIHLSAATRSLDPGSLDPGDTMTDLHLPHPDFSRRALLQSLAGAMATIAVGPAANAEESATAFPSRPVRLIVPLPAGGATDVIARLFAEKLNSLWHQSIIVDNKPGAGTIVGTQLVARALPDGYTFGMVISAFTINPSLRKDLPYDATTDFTPLTLLGFPVIALVGHPSFPANDVGGLIAEARAKPGAISYASLGVGTATHLAGELMNARAGISMAHIPYNGSAPAYNDLLSGRVPVGFVLLDSALPHVRAGKLKVLAITNASRSKIYPDYPTIGETIPGYSVESLFGFVAPRGVPAAIAAKLSSDLIQITAMPDVRQRLTDLSVEPVGSSAAEFEATIKGEIVKWAPIVKASGAKLE